MSLNIKKIMSASRISAGIAALAIAGISFSQIDGRRVMDVTEDANRIMNEHRSYVSGLWNGASGSDLMRVPASVKILRAEIPDGYFAPREFAIGLREASENGYSTEQVTKYADEALLSMRKMEQMTNRFGRGDGNEPLMLIMAMQATREHGSLDLSPDENAAMAAAHREDMMATYEEMLRSGEVTKKEAETFNAALAASRLPPLVRQDPSSEPSL